MPCNVTKKYGLQYNAGKRRAKLPAKNWGYRLLPQSLAPHFARLSIEKELRASSQTVTSIDIKKSLLKYTFLAIKYGAYFVLVTFSSMWNVREKARSVPTPGSNSPIENTCTVNCHCSRHLRDRHLVSVITRVRNSGLR